MSIWTQQRRWALQDTPNGINGKAIFKTEEGISPAEARTALNTVLAMHGSILSHVKEYDPRADVFRVIAFCDEKKEWDVEIRGELIAELVRTARVMSSRNGKRLLRPGEKDDGSLPVL